MPLFQNIFCLQVIGQVLVKFEEHLTVEVGAMIPYLSRIGGKNSRV